MVYVLHKALLLRSTVCLYVVHQNPFMALTHCAHCTHSGGIVVFGLSIESFMIYDLKKKPPILPNRRVQTSVNNLKLILLMCMKSRYSYKNRVLSA